MNIFKIIVLSLCTGLFFTSSGEDGSDVNRKKHLPLLIENKTDKNNYIRFSYNDKYQLTSYENNTSLKTYEGLFSQSTTYSIVYDKKKRIKTILIKQNSTVDSISTKPETTKISCSYKGNIIRLFNETNKNETQLELNKCGQVVKINTPFNQTENISTYEYDTYGNIVKIKMVYANEETQLFESITTLVFDDKPAITRNIPAPQWFKVIYLNIMGLNNNLVSKEYIDSMENSASVTQAIHYLYNAEGYPTEMKFYENKNPKPVESLVSYSNFISE